MSENINYLLKLPKHIIPNSAWHIHYHLLFYLIKSFSPKKIVELGTWHGFSYFSICEIVQSLKLDSLNTKTFGIDNFIGDVHAGYLNTNEVYNLVIEINKEYSNFSTIIKKNFDDASKIFSDKEIDFIHFDGRHFYEDIKYDFETYLPKISDNSIVLFHDTCVEDRNFGIKKFFEEISKNYSTLNFKHGPGLGVIFNGKKAETIKKKIIDENLDDIFSNLGIMSRTYMNEHNYFIETKKNLENNIIELKNDINLIKSSNSWKVTKPLRFIKKIFSK